MPDCANAQCVAGLQCCHWPRTWRGITAPRDSGPQPVWHDPLDHFHSTRFGNDKGDILLPLTFPIDSSSARVNTNPSGRRFQFQETRNKNSSPISELLAYRTVRSVHMSECDVMITLAYIHKLSNEISNQDNYAAWFGLLANRTPTRFYTWNELKSGSLPLSRETLLVGGMESVRTALMQIGITPPSPPSIANELKPHLGRNIWFSTLQEIRDRAHTLSADSSVFIKPKNIAKAFAGHVVVDPSALDLTARFDGAMEILVSDPVSFISEWRFFVLRQEIIGFSHYAGEFLVYPQPEAVRRAIRDYAEGAPIAYAIDFGVTTEDKTLVIEVNDAYALSCYGLQPSRYAEMLVSRWEQIVQSPPTNDAS